MSECKAASLELKAITKNYGAQRALHETTLSIPAGRFTSILGPSGCGKSTTLMLIAGLERPTSGCVLVDGADVTDTPVEKRGIGIVFQNYALFPNLSVEENILYGLRARGADEAVRRNRLREMLELTHLESLAHRFPAQLSGGQQQRVAIARALAPNPRLLLLDEPLSADWDGNELLLSDILGTEPDSVLRPLEDDVDRTLLLHALRRLPERERKIISMRFGLGLPEAMTQKEVADLMGISQSYISRLEKRIIARMRKDILKNYA